MKKRLQGLIAGVLIGAMLTSGAVFAKQISESAELFYNNIKIYIDGGEIVPKDANGNTVEPFIYNGTTYLPVRAISNAFGKDVEWDGAAQSVYIGKKDQTKPDNYLDRIQYNDYKEENGNSDVAIINGTITDFQQNVYTNGLLFWNNSTNRYSIEGETDVAQIRIAYPLNSQYKELKGKIVIPQKYNITTWGEKNCGVAPADVLIYGDGELLYKAVNVTSSMPFNISADVSGVNQLVIKLSSQGNHSHIALTDLALYK